MKKQMPWRVKRFITGKADPQLGMAIIVLFALLLAKAIVHALTLLEHNL